MPFRDPDYENLQRDCDIFPAYSDYLYGPDTRVEVTQEPGLHPQLYPVHHWLAYAAPIRYTNSMPSRTATYQMADSVEQPRNASARRKPDRHEVLRGQGLSRESSNIDMRAQMGSPAPRLLPPQGVARRVSRENMARRQMLNASQQRSMPAPAAPQQQPMRMTRQQTQAKNAATLFSAPQAKPSFLRSSSTTDVDENVTQKSSARTNGMLSPSASPAPMPAQPAHHPFQNAPILPPNPFQSSPSAAPAAPVAAQNPQAQFPILQPSDMVNNPLYSCLDMNRRKYIYGLLYERWNTVRSPQVDQAIKAKVIAEIQHLSLLVHKGLPKLQAVAQTQKQRQAELAQQAQAGQMEQSPQVRQTQAYNMQQAYPHPPPFLASSPAQGFGQHAQLPQYSQQQSLQQQPSLPQFSAPQAYQQPGYSPQQKPPLPRPSPSQQPLLPRPSPVQAYRQNLQQMQQQPQALYTNPPQDQQHQPQSAPQLLHSPSPNMSRTQASPPRPSPQASAQLRENINRHLPELWHCLQLVHERYQSTDLEDIQQKQRAYDWLASFRTSLPREGHGYLQLLVTRMTAASEAGKDPLAAVGIRPVGAQ